MANTRLWTKHNLWSGCYNLLLRRLDYKLIDFPASISLGWYQTKLNKDNRYMLTQQYQQMKTKRNEIMPRTFLWKGVFTTCGFCAHSMHLMWPNQNKCYQLSRLAVDVSFNNIHCIEIWLGVCHIPLMSSINTSALSGRLPTWNHDMR